MLKIVVLLKQTFDTEEKITVKEGTVSEEDAKLVINPYDEYALEEAVLLKEAHGGEVIAVTCGSKRSEEALRTALALGADAAYRIERNGLPEDSTVLSAALAQLIRPMNPDLILAGLFAIDSGAGSVALQTAERLGIPHAAAAVKVEIVPADDPRLAETPLHPPSHQEEGEASSTAASGISSLSLIYAALYALVERDAEGSIEKTAIPLPALITAQQGLNEPRYPSLPGIMKAKKKPLHRMEAAELFKASAISAPSPQTERISLFPPASRAPGRLLNGTAAEQAAALALLLEQSGVIGTGNKL